MSEVITSEAVVRYNWEYLVGEIHWHNPDIVRLESYSAGECDDPCDTSLDEIGAEGWELVQVVCGVGSVPLAYFKRPVEV